MVTTKPDPSLRMCEGKQDLSRINFKFATALSIAFNRSNCQIYSTCAHLAYLPYSWLMGGGFVRLYPLPPLKNIPKTNEHSNVIDAPFKKIVYFDTISVFNWGFESKN